jgi:anti-sigma B factor antagonist
MSLPYMKLSTRLSRARRSSRFLMGSGQSDERPGAAPEPDEVPGDTGFPQIAGSGTETLLGITCSRTGKSTVVVLRGELDLFSRPHLERELKRIETSDPERMIVDLSGLDFMDGAGMHALLGAQRRAQAVGREMSLRRGPRDVHRLFVLAGVEPLFSFEPAPGGASAV